MTIETNAQDEAKKIWEQLDAEDGGQIAPAETTTEQSVDATQPSEPQKTSSEAEQEDDPKVLRDKIAGLEAIVQQFSGRLRNAEGHIGGLNSQLKQQIEVAKRVDSAGGDAPTVREIQAAQDDPKAFAELERDYPEFASAVKAPIDSLRNQLSELQKKVGQPAQSMDSDTLKQEIAALRSEMRVEARHPGWLETVAKPEFAGWLQQSPREMQMLAASDRPEDAVRLLDLYANARNSGAKTNQRLQSAAALPTGQRVTARTKNVDDMTPQEYWRYLDDIDKSKA